MYGSRNDDTFEPIKYRVKLTTNPHTQQIETTKGTGGDIVVLEEAAYVDSGFFYETVAPLLIVGTTTLLAISTLTSEINFYTRLIRLRDKQTNLPMFSVLKVELACQACKDDGKATDCVHMLHLVPRWQSGERHRKLKTIMQDRPDLIESELSGIAFDSLQQCYRAEDIEAIFTQDPLPPLLHDEIFIIIDPAAGGPGSDYSLVSFQRNRGNVTILGIDTLSHCKEPMKQFAMVEEHVSKLRKNVYRSSSKIKIFVERNLGFEAEHHRHGLSHIPNATFYEDHKAGRVGVLTTEAVKYAAMELLNILLRERRVAMCKYFVSRDPKAAKTKLREQLEVFSFQYKQAANTFQKDRAALSGKVGGMRDDVCICLMLGCYWTSSAVVERRLIGAID